MHPWYQPVRTSVFAGAAMAMASVAVAAFAQGTL